MHVDVAVLGAGTGGYTAAVRATQLGLTAAVIEEQVSKFPFTDDQA